LVIPDQPWLDGIKGEVDTVRQFVAMPLGAGYGIGEQSLGSTTVNGLQLRAFEPKPNIFPDGPPPDRADIEMPMRLRSTGPSKSLAIAVGGTIRQKIIHDPYGGDTWDLESATAMTIHIVNSEHFREITGKEPPPTPISAQTYTEHGLPWFDLYEEAPGIVPLSKTLNGVRSVAEIDRECGAAGGEPEASVDIPDTQIRKLHRRKRSAPPEP